MQFLISLHTREKVAIFMYRTSRYIMKFRVRNEIRIFNDVLIIFIFESQAGVWSRVELRHEFGPLYRFHIHNL